MYALLFSCLLVHFFHSAASFSRMTAFFPTKAAKGSLSPVMVTGMLPDLKEIAMCHRLRPLAELTSKGRVTVSYGFANTPNEFVVRFVPNPDQEQEDSQVEVTVRNQTVRLRYHPRYRDNYFRERDWFQVCITWNSFTGRVALLQGLEKVEVENVQEGQTLRGGGNLVVGQYHDPSLGKFDPDESWEGFITDLQIWDRVKIRDFYRCDIQVFGNVIPWLKAHFKVYDGVMLQEMIAC